MSAPMTRDGLLAALVAYAGCRCCGDDDILDDSCPTEDGYKDHTYESDCSRGPAPDVFAALLDRAGVAR